jgi:hypothetical protein
MPITIVLIWCSFRCRRQGLLGHAAFPLESFASDLGRSLGDRPPLVERALQVVLVPSGDQFIGELLDLVALEHEHDLVRRQVDAVPVEALFGEIERQAFSDELGGSILSSLLQTREDC